MAANSAGRQQLPPTKCASSGPPNCYAGIATQKESGDMVQFWNGASVHQGGGLPHTDIETNIKKPAHVLVFQKKQSETVCR